MRRRLDAIRRNDEGSVLVIVLALSVILAAGVAVAANMATANLSFSNRATNSSQAALASQTGLATEVATMRSQSAYTSFPCSGSGSVAAAGITSSYTVAITYSSNGTTLGCVGPSSTLGGATAPTSAKLVSTGTTAHGFSTVMQQDVAIASNVNYQPGLGYAIFSSNNVNLTGDASLNASGGNSPDMYVGQTLSCTRGVLSQGGVITYYPITLGGNCNLGGNLIANGQVTLTNSGSVGGTLTSYGGGVTMSGSSQVGGNTTETAGSISLSGSASIGTTTAHANAYASGSISAPSGAITGTQTPNDSSLSSETMPAQLSFPTIDPSVSTWQSSVDAGCGMSSCAWNVIQVPTSNCSTYFQSNTDNVSGPDPDPFQTAIDTATQPTVIYAPECVLKYTRAQVFQLNADVALEVASITLKNSDTFESTTTATHHFSIVASAGAACSTSTIDVDFSNAPTFASTVSTLIYTPGEADYANASSMTGQILACGGVTGENAFTLNFDPSAADSLPGDSNSLPPTVTTSDKFIVRGQ